MVKILCNQLLASIERLVLNSNAAPFLGVDAKVDLFDWLSFSTVTGVMEFPNAKHINENAWFYRDFDASDEETGEKIYKNHSLFISKATSIFIIHLKIRSSLMNNE